LVFVKLNRPCSSTAATNRGKLPGTGLLGSTTAGALEFETSSASIGARYPMKVTTRPSVDRLSAISDLDGKLVTIWSLFGEIRRSELLGTSSELTSSPDGLSWSSTIFAVMPKLASAASLFQTFG
jgi:hypothetical protein